MPELISIERIRREAQAAATRYSDVNDACPYPFLSDAGHAFRAEFEAAREAIGATKDAHRTAGAAA